MNQLAAVALGRLQSQGYTGLLGLDSAEYAYPDTAEVRTRDEVLKACGELQTWCRREERRG